MGSKLMGYKEFLASPDFARLQESKAPRGPGPSSASSMMALARSKIMGFTEFVGSPEFEHTGREALRLKKDPLKDRKNIDPNLRAARAIRDNSAVAAATAAAMAARKRLFELDHEYPFTSSLLEQAALREKLMAEV